jgi:hypothetical protein
MVWSGLVWRGGEAAGPTSRLQVAHAESRVMSERRVRGSWEHDQHAFAAARSEAVGYGRTCRWRASHHECCWLRLHVARYRLPLQPRPTRRPSGTRAARHRTAYKLRLSQACVAPPLHGRPPRQTRRRTGMSLEVVLDQVIRCSRLRAHCNLS